MQSHLAGLILLVYPTVSVRPTSEEESAPPFAAPLSNHTQEPLIDGGLTEGLRRDTRTEGPMGSFARAQPSFESLFAKRHTELEVSADSKFFPAESGIMSTSGTQEEIDNHSNVKGGAATIQRGAQLLLEALGAPNMGMNLVLGTTPLHTRKALQGSYMNIAASTRQQAVNNQAQTVAVNSLVEVDSKTLQNQRLTDKATQNSHGHHAVQYRDPNKRSNNDKNPNVGENDLKNGHATTHDSSGPCGAAEACQFCESEHGFVCSHTGDKEFKCVPFCLSDQSKTVAALRSATMWSMTGAKHCFEALDDDALFEQTKHHCTKQDIDESVSVDALSKDLPDSWEAVWDPQKKTAYYINRKCGPSATQWERPSPGPCPDHSTEIKAWQQHGGKVDVGGAAGGGKVEVAQNYAGTTTISVLALFVIIAAVVV